MSGQKALFWDFDGTLAWSKSLWTGSVHGALRLVEPDTAVTIEDVRPLMQAGYTWHTPEKDYLHLREPALWWENMRRHFTGIYSQLGVSSHTAGEAAGLVRELILRPENYYVYEDAAPTLDACRQAGFRCYILSNNYPELPAIIESIGLSRFFCGYTISALVGYEKPRREIFASAMAMAGNPDVRYMIGDIPVADIGGARAAGIPAILVHGSDECSADFTCAELRQIPGAIGISAPLL